MSAHPRRERARTTFESLAAKKANAEPIAMVTAYDYPSAQIADAAGVTEVTIRNRYKGLKDILDLED